MDLISVIVPIYNVEPYLKKCLDSIINQTYKNLEIILIDDGSPDNCGKICDEYAKKDSRIVVVHQENAGLAGAKNVGISIAKGKYLGFVDSDDWIACDMYEVLLNALEKHDCDIAVCGRYVVSEDGNEKPFFALDNPVVWDSQEAMRHGLLGDILDVASWDKLYKKEVFDGITYPSGYVSEDVPVAYELFSRVNRIVHCGKNLYYYLQRSGSLSRSVFSQKSMGLYYYHKEVKEKTAKKFPQLAEENEYCYYSGLLRLFLIMASASGDFPERKLIRKELAHGIKTIISNKYIKKPYKLFALASVFHVEKVVAKIRG